MAVGSIGFMLTRMERPGNLAMADEANKPEPGIEGCFPQWNVYGIRSTEYSGYIKEYGVSFSAHNAK